MLIKNNDMQLNVIKINWSEQLSYWTNVLWEALVKQARGGWVVPGFLLFLILVTTAFLIITALFLITDMLISMLSSIMAFKSWIYGAAIGALLLYPLTGKIFNLSWWYSVVADYPSSGPDPLACLKEYKYERYATAPNHEKRIQEILLAMGFMSHSAEIDAYIQGVAPGSPVKGYMVKQSADKYRVDARLMLALMHADSHFGLYGKGARTKNPGNVGNDDSGKLAHKKSWDEGVEAVAKWLDKNRKIMAVGEAPRTAGLFLIIRLSLLKIFLFKKFGKCLHLFLGFQYFFCCDSRV